MGDIIFLSKKRGINMGKNKVPKCVEKMRSREISYEQCVRELIRYAEIDTIPIDVYKIANKLGCATYAIPLKPGIRGALVDLNEPFMDNEKRVVLLDKNSPEKRQAFTAAHEIGHLCLHCSDTADFYMRESEHETEEDVKKENEADLFAATLLMPDEIFRSYVKKLKGMFGNDYQRIIDRLCTMFYVEEEAVEKRLIELNINL